MVHVLEGKFYTIADVFLLFTELFAERSFGHDC